MKTIDCTHEKQNIVNRIRLESTWICVPFDAQHRRRPLHDKDLLFARDNNDDTSAKQRRCIFLTCWNLRVTNSEQKHTQRHDTTTSSCTTSAGRASPLATDTVGDDDDDVVDVDVVRSTSPPDFVECILHKTREKNTQNTSDNKIKSNK